MCTHLQTEKKTERIPPERKTNFLLSLQVEKVNDCTFKSWHSSKKGPSSWSILSRPGWDPINDTLTSTGHIAHLLRQLTWLTFSLDLDEWMHACFTSTCLGRVLTLYFMHLIHKSNEINFPNRFLCILWLCNSPTNAKIVRGRGARTTNTTISMNKLNCKRLSNVCGYVLVCTYLLETRLIFHRTTLWHSYDFLYTFPSFLFLLPSKKVCKTPSFLERSLYWYFFKQKRYKE